MMAAPDFPALLRVFARIGCLSFGGPAGQVALMHKELVEERAWVEEGQFLRALNFCHLLPGPEAQQLAIYIGWKLHGLRGGLAAGMLFVLPGAAVILALSILYVFAATLPWFGALFLGVKAAVLALVVQALLRIARRALKTDFQRGLSFASFVALFAFDLPFPLVVLGAGAIGIVVAGRSPGLLPLKPVVPAPTAGARLGRATLRIMLAWGLIWAAPMALIALTLGPDHVLFRIGAFFSKLAVVTFGGAYAVLAYMAQQAVTSYHWLSAGEMADGLGLAETTPGPLVMVTQFVGFLASYRAPAPFAPLVAGILGAALTTWVTFAPCFLFVLALAPWIERLEHARRLQGGLAALTAAVVGVIANLALWFALHLLFARMTDVRLAGMALHLPDLASFDVRAALLAILAAVLLFRLKLGVVPVLAISAGCAMAAQVAA
jgi:chromate transporter